MGHLNLSRSIPSLSGGELQRLRIAKLLLGKLNDIFIILDEPTSSLHPKECKLLCENIKNLTKKNTVIAVDHNKELLKFADSTIFLGPKSGKFGGEIVPKEMYMKNFNSNFKRKFFESKKTLRIDLNSDKIKFNDALKIRLWSLTGISSMSGVSINISLKSRLGQMLIRRLQHIAGFLLTLKTNLQKI